MVASLLSYPLKHVVRSPTRGSAILDEIYTNLQDWYEKPVILPNIARSDHKAVLMTPTIVTKAKRGKDITMMVRSQDSNVRALLAQAINHTDWTPLYQLQTCDEMVNTFYSTLSGLIDHYLPMLTVKRHTSSTDKPWVTDQFRRLICCRQHAWKAVKSLFIGRTAIKCNECPRRYSLQCKYYAKRIEGLRTSNPVNWWRSVKLVTALKTNEPLLSGFANQIHDGDMHTLATSVPGRPAWTPSSRVSPLILAFWITKTPLLPDILPSDFCISSNDVERKAGFIRKGKEAYLSAF